MLFRIFVDGRPDTEIEANSLRQAENTAKHMYPTSQIIAEPMVPAGKFGDCRFYPESGPVLDESEL